MMKTINLLKLASIALFMVFAFGACKKDKTTPRVDIKGKWTGIIEGFDYDGSYFFNIMDGGKLEVEYGIEPNDIIEGTWELKGSVFTATYSISDGPVNATATFDSSVASGGKLTPGTWQFKDYPDVKGKWSMTKDKVQ
ncbi:MAG: hypothetical protein WBP45_08230 [Daejeonella sp.]